MFLIFGFEIVDNKVVANSDNDVDNIRKTFPVGTIITTHHNDSQLSGNEYSENYYIVKKNKRVEGAEYLLKEDEELSENVIHELSNRNRSRSRSRDKIMHSSSKSRSRSRDKSMHSRRKNGGGKRRTIKKCK